MTATSSPAAAPGGMRRTAEAIAALYDLLGDRLATAQAARAHHGQDESHHAQSLPDAVAFPLSTEEVAAIAAVCHGHHVPMVPFGPGSGLEGGAGRSRSRAASASISDGWIRCLP